RLPAGLEVATARESQVYAVLFLARTFASDLLEKLERLLEAIAVQHATGLAELLLSLTFAFARLAHALVGILAETEASGRGGLHGAQTRGGDRRRRRSRSNSPPRHRPPLRR